MDKYSELEKNTVEARKQLAENSYIRFTNPDGKGKRVIFMGNSITLHGIKEDIGWFNEWGMAASSRENDFVHLCMKMINEKYPDAYFCVVQAAGWEREYNEYNVREKYALAGEFNPDVIITRLSENIQVDYLEKNPLVPAMEKFQKFLSGDSEPKLIVTSNVFNNKLKDGFLKEYAEKNGVEYVYMNDYMEDKENLANEYEHEGVRIHPGDKGMKFIADRIMEKFNELM